MDRVKAEVAARVQRMVLDTNWNLVVPSTGLTVRPSDATRAGDLETMIGIRTPAGSRYFVVKVKEQY